MNQMDSFLISTLEQIEDNDLSGILADIAAKEDKFLNEVFEQLEEENRKLFPFIL